MITITFQIFDTEKARRNYGVQRSQVIASESYLGDRSISPNPNIAIGALQHLIFFTSSG
jgi:hypothetical protein